MTGDTRLESASHDLTLWPCPGCGSYCVVRDVPRTDAPRPQRIEEPAVPIEATKPARNEWTQGKLPGVDRGKQSVTIREPEKVIQSRIVRVLKTSGYIVLETSERRKPVPCPNCLKWFVPRIGRPGVSKGLTDLLVRNPRWAPCFGPVYVAIEVKGYDTRVSPEQQLLAEEGNSNICRSPEEALRIMRTVDRFLLGESY